MKVPLFSVQIISVDDGGGEQAKEPEALTDILEQSNIMEESHIREVRSEAVPQTCVCTRATLNQKHRPIGMKRGMEIH